MREQVIADRFKELITSCVEAHDLADHLEKVLWGYVLYASADDEICGHPDNMQSLYWCKALLDVLKSEGNS